MPPGPWAGRHAQRAWSPTLGDQARWLSRTGMLAVPDRVAAAIWSAAAVQSARLRRCNQAGRGGAIRLAAAVQSGWLRQGPGRGPGAARVQPGPQHPPPAVNA